MENGSTVVAVAVGQIRSGRLRYHKDAMPYEVLEVSGHNATIRQDGHQSTAGIALEDLLLWPCIGLVTPHGRVMVGERRLSPCEAHRMVSKVVGDFVAMPLDGDYGDDSPRLWPAATVASWPLISPPTHAEQKIVARNHGDGPAYLYLFDASRIAPPFCACGLPMPSGCVMCPGCAAEKILTPKETDLYQQAIEDCNRAICGHSADPREQGPGIYRLPPPEVRPDVVVTAAWEDRWTTP